jgi:hypothetical protein
MKIQFDDGSYVDCKKDNDKIILIISARDYENPRKKINNTVELTIEEFKQFISDIELI